jgi:hypothetical protein
MPETPSKLTSKKASRTVVSRRYETLGAWRVSSAPPKKPRVSNLTHLCPYHFAILSCGNAGRSNSTPDFQGEPSCCCKRPKAATATRRNRRIHLRAVLVSARPKPTNRLNRLHTVGGKLTPVPIERDPIDIGPLLHITVRCGERGSTTPSVLSVFLRRSLPSSNASFTNDELKTSLLYPLSFTGLDPTRSSAQSATSA